MKVLITLGPTQEPIDSIRYITNASSGRMGATLAVEAMNRGHEVTIVSGPVSIDLPLTRTIRIRTADEMNNAVLSELSRGYDMFISAAAVADYAPKVRQKGKIKSGKADFVLELIPTKKITREAKKNHPRLYVVSFKAETDESKEGLIRRAKYKMDKECLDIAVANDISKYRMGSEENEVYIVRKDGSYVHVPRKKKEDIAVKIWDEIEKDRK